MPRRGEGQARAEDQRQTVTLPLAPTAAGRCSTTRSGTTSTSKPTRRRSARSSGSLAEAEDRCARGPRPADRASLQLQVVSADELFYEILIRQRAERAKFLAVLEAAEKQTPVLAGTPSAEDIVRVMRGRARRHPAARPDRRPDRRHAPGDEAEPDRLAQVAPPAPGRGHRPDPRPQRRPDDRAARRPQIARRRPASSARPTRRRLDGCTAKSWRG